MRLRRRAQGVRGPLALGLGALVLLASTPAFVVGNGPDGTDLIGAVAATGYGIAGGALAWARPRNALGWLLLLVGGLNAGGASLSAWAASAQAADAPARTLAAWLASWLWFPALAMVPTALLLHYPSGAVTSPARKRLLAASLLGVVLVSSALGLSTSGVDDVAPGLVNPVAAEPVSRAAAVAGFAVLVPAVVLCIADAVRRLRRARSPEREQLAWFLLTVLALVLGSYTPWTGLRAAVQTLVPFAIAMGVVRHRLLDLQVVVRRTLLFAGLTAAVVVVFAVTTTAFSGLVDGGPLPVAVAAALVAVGLTPLRERLQRSVDRLVYGDRRDPVRAVATLGRHVAEREDDALVQHVLTAVADAVRSPCVALAGPDGDVQARVGAGGDGQPLQLPLQVAARDVGALLVWPRTKRDGWSRSDRDLLAVLAPQVAVVVHAARLNVALTQSRDGVLAATADERLRLRQELHDGLGPALSGIALGLEAAEVALPRDPRRAGALLERLRQETQTAGREVRRLVEGLRPAALDGQDLAEALQGFVDGLAAVTAGRLVISLEVAAPLPPLPPDVDAATYRIVTEAVTNVVRHSGARTCVVVVAAGGGVLSVRVEDDGTGLATSREGVGLGSMRRRAAELGGTWTVGGRPGGGTRVQVELPLRCATDRGAAPAGALA